ncbi:hypothetical protein AMS68_002252 [Peltaster fructicola]|uniref:FAD-binding PCMH-type domain-containing protein n=1 Tax=Peltaster fructicola TaxID=286661 RepID=A0A6H0XQ25_9PEZI|nr:hypothetical protein AMS68_002252 [Peltaster fructicola]
MRLQRLAILVASFAAAVRAQEEYDDCYDEPDNDPNDTQAACQDLLAALPDQVAFPSNSSVQQSSNLTNLYATTTSTYWDLANTLDVPACIVFPSSAEDVSTTVNILQDYDEVKFNLKSGGHNFNRGFSSTDGGVLISFRPYMQDTVLSDDASTASVGPGARWSEAMPVAQARDRCLVGGRAADVGVGGYVILGGISYLSGQYGFSSDNVVNFQVVLADGSIVDANKTSHPELYFALRGGASNFAIVTRYTLLTHPIGSVWAGSRIYSSDKTPQLTSALTNFIANSDNSTKQAAMIPTVIWVGGSSTYIWSMFLFWDGPSPPSDVFAEFLAIDALSDSTKVQSYPEALNGANAASIGGRTTDRVNPLANLPHDNMTEFLQWHIAQLDQAPWLNNTEAGFVLANLALQPINVELQRSNGVGVPGALHVDPAGGDKMWIEYSLAWRNSSWDDRMVADLAKLVDEGQQYQ